jgi:Uma2 family endonuclease
MATQTSTTGSGVVPYRITARQFVKMIDAGVFPEGDHVELLGGILVAMTKNEVHDYIVGLLGDIFRVFLPAGCFVREEKSSQLGRYWRPEPDFSVVRGQRADYLKRSPGGRDIGLLVEVADSSYPKDSKIKLWSYASARIPTYWIVNVARRQIEVYTDPQGRGRSARYHQIAIHDEKAQVPVVLDGQERGRIAVKDLLP